MLLTAVITILGQTTEHLGQLLRKDMTLLMGDLNAKRGKDNIGYEEVMDWEK